VLRILLFQKVIHAMMKTIFIQNNKVIDLMLISVLKQ